MLGGQLGFCLGEIVLKGRVRQKLTHNGLAQHAAQDAAPADAAADGEEGIALVREQFGQQQGKDARRTGEQSP